MEDCTQKVHKYVNYELLEEKDHHKLGGKALVAVRVVGCGL